MSAIYLRTIGPGDWPLWRRLRLEALAEAPYAFGSKLADWQGIGDTETRWRTRLTAMPINVIAELDGNEAGMVSASDRNEDGAVELISMWVAPFARGHGIGDSLVMAVIDWARRQRATGITLDVTEDNSHAMALYRRHGFVYVVVAEGIAAEVRRECRMVLCL